MPSPTLSALLAKHVAERPEKLAIADGERRVDQAGFQARTAATVRWLRGQGIGRGDRVAVWLVNRTEWLVLLFALARVGATLVSVNTRYRAAELEYLLARSRARMLVLQPGFRAIDFPAVLDAADPARMPALERVAVVDAGDRLPATLLGRPTVAFDACDAFDAAPVTAATMPPGLDDSDPDAVTILFTTSGTTRDPKLVMHSQRTLAHHARQVARAYGLDAADARLLGALPLCGTFGLVGVLAAMAAAAPVVLMDAFDGAVAARHVQEHAITHMYGSDEMYRRMLEAAPGPDPFPSARQFGYAAFQPGGAGFARDAMARGLPLAGLYGSSEVQALFSVQPASLAPDARIEGGGRPAAADARVRIRKLDSGELARPGESGEIEIAALGNFVGYLDDADATAAAIGADGFFRTGDIGHLRDDGTFVYETRRGDAIRLGGFLVNPAEIEDTIKGLGGVDDVAVIAVDIDARPRCVAFVVPAAGARPSAEALIESARRVMAGFKVPARIWFVDALPVTASANGTKVQRARLREMAAERLAPAGWTPSSAPSEPAAMRPGS